jgi:hypothetical protein
MHLRPRIRPVLALFGSVLLPALLGVVAAACSSSGDFARCETTADCATQGGGTCVDGRCQLVDGGVPTDTGAALPDGGPVDSGPCAANERACGETCCGGADICGTNLACCTYDELCGSSCCGAGEVCEGALCRRDCGAEARCTDSAGAEVCCVAGEVCSSGQCFAPSTPCQDFLDCPADQYCEPTQGFCLPQPSGEVCQSEPSGGQVLPTELWHWDGVGAVLPTYRQVMMTPMVANLNDDNNDSVVDLNDTPDIVFATFVTNYTSDGVLRAISGADGSSIFDVTDPTLRVTPGGQVALGDIDNDGRIDIVACASDPTGLGPLIAFERDGTFKWRSVDPDIRCGQAGPSIADLDGDGNPEVFVRYSVVNGVDGSRRWHNDCVNTGGYGTAAHNPCDYTTAADLDGDGKLEVVGGNAAYHHDGTTHYDRTADFLDGYPAVGDLDMDGVPEVVVVHSAFYPTSYSGDHFLRALNADGTDRWGPFDTNAAMAPAADVTANQVGGGGPPTLANFDDDPAPEIALAGAYGYAVFEADGSLKWFSTSNDRSSRKTGSSVFDFDGDGVSDAVYNDQYWLRVYDGSSGDVQFCQCNTSATLWEYPVIVDVNNDGHAEIVLASNDYASGYGTCPMTADLGACEVARIGNGENLGTHGIRVFASPNSDWIGTRRIWNQHTYHVTNVSELGAIPASEPRNWTTRSLNNFRTNVQPDATNIPDITPEELAVDLRDCHTQMTLNFRLTNNGWSASPVGVPATVYAEEDGTFVRVARVTTTRALLAGEGEAMSVPYPLVDREHGEAVRFRVVVNDENDAPLLELNECRPDNNSAETTSMCFTIG